MLLHDEIEAIRTLILGGQFTNEASVSQGIVLRLLHALDWPAYDTQVVWPEYTLNGRRVDFALCHPRGRPRALIEVKQIGQANGAERQLFEYAFHEGVPMAVLTDGQEWNFFLPAEQGNYGERRVYKLDILRRDLDECAERLKRYLLYTAVTTGAALRSARDDYLSIANEREMANALPLAWRQIIDEEDELLFEIIADRVELLCGMKPAPDMVARFLKERINRDVTAPTLVNPITTRDEVGITELAPNQRNPNSVQALETGAGYGFTLAGIFHPATSAIDVTKQVFEELARLDATFPQRFASVPHGRRRRYLALKPDDLYPGRADLAETASTRLSFGWWLGTNYSKQQILRILKTASRVASLEFGTDLIIRLGA